MLDLSGPCPPQALDGCYFKTSWARPGKGVIGGLRDERAQPRPLPRACPHRGVNKTLLVALPIRVSRGGGGPDRRRDGPPSPPRGELGSLLLPTGSAWESGSGLRPKGLGAGLPGSAWRRGEEPSAACPDGGPKATLSGPAKSMCAVTQHLEEGLQVAHRDLPILPTGRGPWMGCGTGVVGSGCPLVSPTCRCHLASAVPFGTADYNSWSLSLSLRPHRGSHQHHQSHKKCVRTLIPRPLPQHREEGAVSAGRSPRLWA